MTEQINLFDQIESDDRDAKARKAVREAYRQWLTASCLTPCDPDIRYLNYGIYDGVIHVCETMPDTEYMWENTCARNDRGGQFWCLQKRGAGEGIQMDKCPYCGADLSAKKGPRFLRKASGFVYAEKSYRKYYGLDEIEMEVMGK